jgi:hypothetical protein
MDRPTVIRARLARAKRSGEPVQVLKSLERDYYASRARSYVIDWLTGDPAPTPEQRAEVAALLVGGETVATAA